MTWRNFKAMRLRRSPTRREMKAFALIRVDTLTLARVAQTGGNACDRHQQGLHQRTVQTRVLSTGSRQQLGLQ
jgi:hypothetical protein